MHGCIASQPIFNLNKEIFGYELLYRKSKDSSEYDGVNGNYATQDVILTAFSEIGIENITRGSKAFVNFTSDLILNETPYMLSNDILVVELLENIKPSEAVIAACVELKKKGYMIALDDFVYSEEYERLLEISDIIKIDFLLCNAKDIRRFVQKINRNHRKILLAEKVETNEDYELAVSLGFTLFQGFFFCKPIITTIKRIDSLRASQLQLVAFASDPDVNFLDLANVIKADVVLSCRLLKIVNSAYYGLRYSVRGILHALIILGQRETKKWLSLIILNEVMGAKPNELIRLALIRGIFMENIAMRQRDKNCKDEYFLIGLFSLSEAIMDAPLKSILNETHLSPEICEPLLTETGQRADYIKIICHIERAEWDAADEIAQKYGLDEDAVNTCYIKAMIDANKIMEYKQ